MSPAREGDVRVLGWIVGVLLLIPRDVRAQGPGESMPGMQMGTHSAEHGAPAMAMAPGPLGIPPTREGSGTSWEPDDSPMYMLGWQAGGWELDAMWNVFAQYLRDGGSRGHDQLGSVDWLMAMARHPLGPGQLRARVMLSLEPWTLGRCGYPDLLATGETCHGAPLHDRQHPHDTFMELSAAYALPLTGSVALDVYGALSGEPALGPVAFPHRISSMPDPVAPMTHHWLDSTHISFGVVTAGVYGRRWKLEGSAFNGREPDENRKDLDLGPLDSFSGRIWVEPDAHWSLQVSSGHLRDAEAGIGGSPRSDVDRTTASATHHRTLGDRGVWATTAAWGVNVEHGQGSNGALVETVVDPDERNVLFARVEAAQKSGAQLLIPGGTDAQRWVGKLALGYVRQVSIDVGAGRSILLGVGASVSVSAVPSSWEGAYGRGWPLGFGVFLGTRPGPMQMR